MADDAITRAGIWDLGSPLYIRGLRLVKITIPLMISATWQYVVHHTSAHALLCENIVNE